MVASTSVRFSGSVSTPGAPPSTTKYGARLRLAGGGSAPAAGSRAAAASTARNWRSAFIIAASPAAVGRRAVERRHRLACLRVAEFELDRQLRLPVDEAVGHRQQRGAAAQPVD